jgi:periplasmic protein TonB
MASISLADQLDDAIERMFTEPDSAPRVDLATGELLGIAEELRLLPDPRFKAALRAELLGGRYALAGAAGTDVRRLAGERQKELDARILPSLFGADDGIYPVHRGNFAISAAIHASLIAAVATGVLWFAKQPQLSPHATSVVLTELTAPVMPLADRVSRGGGGGGDRDKMEESHGSLPRFARSQIVPPTIIVRNERPKLPAEPTVVSAPELSVLPTSQIGNPLSAILPSLSNGTGSGGGIGNGEGGGAGPGYGPGFGPGSGGGAGGGAFRVGGGVSAPHATYAPDPEYSEEARRAKYQGTVLLGVIVGSDGRPRDIRVQRSLGMGLDEKAIEAVRQWRFDPSLKDGHPVAVEVNIEVSFRLY